MKAFTVAVVTLCWANGTTALVSRQQLFSSSATTATSTSIRHSSSMLSMIIQGSADGSSSSSSSIRAYASTEAIPFASSSGGGGGGGASSTSFGGASDKGRRRRKPVARPPAVDSTLLRFVSSQKQEQRLVPTTTNNNGNNNNNGDVGSSSSNSKTMEPWARSRTTSASNTAASAASTDAWWWGQFNSHRIVSVLLEKDSELSVEAAERAGEAVQSQALARKARRQIRTFLKERDRVLMVGPQQQQQQDPTITPNGSAETTMSTTANNGQQLSSQQPLHTFEESVDVMLELGLTVKDLVEILQHTPGIALMRPRGENEEGETLETTLTRVLTLLTTTLKLRRYHARKVIRACPGLLTMRRSKAAEQVVLIMSRLGVSAKALSRDLPALCLLLLRPPASVFRLVSFLASDAIRMPVKNIGPLLRRRECRELLDRVAPVPSRQVLMSSDEQDDEVDGIVDAVDPTVASALWGRESIHRRERIEETYQRMSKTAWTLRHEIGTKDLGKVIAAYPSVLLLDAQDTILPNANYLMNDLGIWEDDLPKVLQLYPTLLGTDLDRMKGVADFLLSLEVPQENLASIFRSFPHLLTLDVEECMQPVVDFLRSVGIGNVGRFIGRLPSILGYSVDRELRPKWNYLAGVCADPRFEVTKFPAYFSYPLERVIKPRYEYLRHVKSVPTQFLAVDQIMSFGDKDFATKVVGDLDEGQNFLLFCDRRKKARYAAAADKKPQRYKKKGGLAPVASESTASEVPIESSRR